jgi:hypothetical protein
MGIGGTRVLPVVLFSCFVPASKTGVNFMAAKKQAYTVKVTGPGHNFERTIDELTAGQILSLIMVGATATSNASGAKHTVNNATPAAAGTAIPKNISLAALIKAKKGDKNGNTRFLATAFWLSGRSEEPLTAKAVATALSVNNQKKLTNPSDCLNQNVRKGFCEKRPDGSFFITPEGLEALEGMRAE